MTETYVVFGVAAAVFFLVGGVRAFSMPRYGSLFDETAPRENRVGGAAGRFSGRDAEIDIVPSDHIRSRPARLRVSLGCDAPFQVEAVRESLATGFRKAVGLQSDRKTGVEDLDRLYAFQFFDRRTMEACVGRIEVRESLVSLADLGADSIHLRDARLTAEFPMRFIVPPSVGRVRQILTDMATLGSGMESAVSAGSPGAAASSGNARTAASAMSPEGLETSEDPSRAARRAALAIEAPVFYATFFVAMTAAFLIVGSFWDFNGKIPWRTRMDIVSGRLPALGLLSGFSGFLAGLLVPRRPVSWGFQLSWPLILHAGLAWVFYIVLRVSDIPGLERELAGEGEFVRAVLTGATTAPAVAFGTGFLGALLGGRLSPSRQD